jgi:predicted DNA-binding transcriptional regulator AlpA
MTDLGRELGITRQAVYDLLRRRPDFPSPVDHWARGDLWAASDVRRWARTYEGDAARWGSRD